MKNKQFRWSAPDSCRRLDLCPSNSGISWDSYFSVWGILWTGSYSSTQKIARDECTFTVKHENTSRHQLVDDDKNDTDDKDSDNTISVQLFRNTSCVLAVLIIIIRKLHEIVEIASIASSAGAMVYVECPPCKTSLFIGYGWVN